jgi:hypothetical protein
MFGKTRDSHDTDTLDTSAFAEFFGDEAAAEREVEIHNLRDRVEQVESQISSQFTSLATYAQIAQEQVELARSEARAANERSEQRLTALIGRERADRLAAATGGAPTGTPKMGERLDALESAVARIQRGLDDCRVQQMELALAITTMVERLTVPQPHAKGVLADVVEQVPPPPHAPTTFDPPTPDQAVDPHGPIHSLALNG